MSNGATELLGNAFADGKTKVSLVLSGGADLAVFFQLGAINILHDHLGMRREKLYMIAGGSGGAISGLLTAAGVNSDKPSLVPSVEEVLKEDKGEKELFERLGIYSQDGVVAHIRNMIGDGYAHFRDLPVDLRIASTMVFPFIKKVVFSRENCHLHGREVTTFDAMKCSITVPALYTPVKLGDGALNRSYHLDGEIFLPTPVEEARDSDVMVLVSVYGPFKGFIPVLNLQARLENRYNSLRKHEMNRRIEKLRKHNPKLKVILIENAPDDYDTATFQKFSMKDVEELKAAGRRAAWKCEFYPEGGVRQPLLAGF